MNINELVGYLARVLCTLKIEWLSVLKCLFDKLTVDGGDAVISGLSQWMSADEVSITVDRGRTPPLPSEFTRFYRGNQDSMRPRTFSLNSLCATPYKFDGNFLSVSGAQSLMESYARIGILENSLTLQDGQEIVKLGTNAFVRVFGNKLVLLFGSCVYFKDEISPRVPCLGVSDDGYTLTISYLLITQIIFSEKYTLITFKSTTG